VQQPPHKKQCKHGHNDDAVKCTGKFESLVPAKPAATSVLSSADSRARSCSPPEPPPPAVSWAAASDGGLTARAMSGLELVLGQDWLPDAPLGCHPPREASKPCAPEADPVLRPCKRARGESVGHWIDAALADEGWWEAGWWGSGKGTQLNIWGGCFEDSDECFDPLLAGAYAEVQLE
jgi:hypothetical protein